MVSLELSLKTLVGAIGSSVRAHPEELIPSLVRSINIPIIFYIIDLG